MLRAMAFEPHGKPQATTPPIARRGKRLTAVLGPTNTGKTHLAVERLLGHASGMIGLPLRLLAREIYDRVAERAGAQSVALVTGEERITPASARYVVCTVESMPLDRSFDFVAVDEVQLCADAERGHVFTDRVLRARGTEETMLLGSDTMRPVLRQLLPDANFVSRPRFSDLTYTGPRKLSRLPRRSAVIAFSTEGVYGLAELIRRQRGGAAVVMGVLSPRTRNAQVALYQSGDVDFLVATDAIGMGLNMDIDHVAFASLSKFDGEVTRPLRAAEIAQIAGRAGRHMNDGTFGPTGDVPPIANDLVEQIESHRFDPIRILQWRNHAPDFSSLDLLMQTLDAPPPAKFLVRARASDDLAALRTLAQDAEIRAFTRAPAAVKQLWEVCRIPDFRKVTVDEHARLLGELFRQLMQNDGILPADFIARYVDRIDCVEGDLDTLSQRISQIRIWTYIAHREHWLADAAHWQERTRAIEDTLSDALHQALTLRFVDRRTSVLMRRLRQEDELTSEVRDDGELLVEGEYVGRLNGFQFIADPRGEASELGPKTLRHAASRALVPELAARAVRLAAAPDDAFSLKEHGRIWWEESPVARLVPGADVLTPKVHLVADDILAGSFREHAVERLEQFVRNHIARVLLPLIALRDAEGLSGLTRGLAFDLARNLGGMPRAEIAATIRALVPEARSELRKLGVRIGAHSVFLPALLKPSAAALKLLLWTVAEGEGKSYPPAPAPGLVSVPVENGAAPLFYERAGFRVVGPRAIRLDILERLADLLRPPKPPVAVKTAESQTANVEVPSSVSAESAQTESEPPTVLEPPPAAPELAPAAPEPPPAVPAPAAQVSTSPVAGDGSFRVTAMMMSSVGCSAEEFDGVLKALGFRPVLRQNETGQAELTWRPSHRREERPAGRPEREKRPAEKKRRHKPHKPSPPPGQVSAEQKSKGAIETKAKPARDMGPVRDKGRVRDKGPVRDNKPRERPVDPNSPFAILAQLRPILDKSR